MSEMFAHSYPACFFRKSQLFCFLLAVELVKVVVRVTQLLLLFCTKEQDWILTHISFLDKLCNKKAGIIPLVLKVCSPRVSVVSFSVSACPTAFYVMNCKLFAAWVVPKFFSCSPFIEVALHLIE